VAVHSAVAPNTNFAALRTFAFMAPVDPQSRAAQLDRSPAGQQIHQQIAQNLMAKGFVPAQAPAQPDFLVAYRTLYRQRTDVANWGGWGWGWGWGWSGWAWGGPDVTVYQYTEGTIVVDFVDPASHRVLWRGTASSIVQHPDNPNLAKIAKAVDKLMTRVPATGMASAGGRTGM